MAVGLGERPLPGRTHPRPASTARAVAAGRSAKTDRGPPDVAQRALRASDRPARIRCRVMQPVDGGLALDMPQLIVNDRGVEHRIVAPVLVEGNEAVVGKHHRHGD